MIALTGARCGSAKKRPDMKMCHSLSSGSAAAAGRARLVRKGEMARDGARVQGRGHRGARTVVLTIDNDMCDIT